MKEYMYEGNKYYFTGKKWLDDSRLEAPLAVVGKLNNLLLRDTDITRMSNEELLKFSVNLKDGENIQLAIKAFELLLTKNDIFITKQIMPRLVSSYRKVGKSEYAIKVADQYCNLFKGKINSSVLFTTLAAAYCDVENYEEARRYANLARSMNGNWKKSSQELINVYSRLKKYDGGAVKKQTYNDILDCDGKNTEEVSEQTDILKEDKTFEARPFVHTKVEFAGSVEYEAMDRIWRAIPSLTRKEYYDDFKLICESLKNHTLTATD